MCLALAMKGDLHGPSAYCSFSTTNAEKLGQGGLLFPGMALPGAWCYLGWHHGKAVW